MTYETALLQMQIKKQRVKVAKLYILVDELENNMAISDEDCSRAFSVFQEQYDILSNMVKEHKSLVKPITPLAEVLPSFDKEKF